MAYLALETAEFLRSHVKLADNPSLKEMTLRLQEILWRGLTVVNSAQLERAKIHQANLSDLIEQNITIKKDGIIYSLSDCFIDGITEMFLSENR
jgi:hypothetical protein